MSDAYSWIISTIGGILILYFVTFFVYDIVKKITAFCKARKHGDFEEVDNTTKDLRFLIYLNLLIILTHGILNTLNLIFSSTVNCLFLTKICTLLYHISRFILYIIFVRRIQVSYTDTVFALSSFHFIFLYSIIFVYAIPYISYINGNLIDVSMARIGCHINYQTYPYLLSFCCMSFVDIGILCYCTVLLIRPLTMLIKEQTDKQIAAKLYQVIIKFSALYGLSIVSSVILAVLSFAFAFGHNYAIIDAFVDGSILILFHPIHNKLYKRACCPLHACCTQMWVDRATRETKLHRPSQVPRASQIPLQRPSAIQVQPQPNGHTAKPSSSAESDDEDIGKGIEIVTVRDEQKVKTSMTGNQSELNHLQQNGKHLSIRDRMRLNMNQRVSQSLDAVVNRVDTDSATVTRQGTGMTNSPTPDLNGPGSHSSKFRVMDESPTPAASDSNHSRPKMIPVGMLKPGRSRTKIKVIMTNIGEGQVDGVSPAALPEPEALSPLFSPLNLTPMSAGDNGPYNEKMSALQEKRSNTLKFINRESSHL